MYIPNGNEKLYITELLIGNINSQISFLFLNLDGTRPVYHDNKIILFSEIHDAEKALQYSNCGSNILSNIPEKIENELDFALVMNDLEGVVQRSDSVIRHSGNFLDCLQFLMDIYFDTIHEESDIQLASASTSKRFQKNILPEEVTDKFYRILFCASNFFIFDVDVRQFAQNTGYEAKDLLFAFKYALGDLITNACFLSD